MTQFPADMNLQTVTTVTGAKQYKVTDTQQQSPSHDEHWAKALADYAQQQGGTASTPNLGTAIGGYTGLQQPSGACPHCGYCPHCGHHSPTHPLFAYPSYPIPYIWSGSPVITNGHWDSGTAQMQGVQTHQNIN